MNRRRGVVVAALVLVAGCASAPSTPPSASPSPPVASAPTASADEHVDGAKAKSLVAAGAKLVDVRTPEEYAEKHIDGAVNAPVDTIGDRELGAKDAPLVLYCGKGPRAARAAAALRAKGYSRVYELGAMSNWDK